MSEITATRTYLPLVRFAHGYVSRPYPTGLDPERRTGRAPPQPVFYMANPCGPVVLRPVSVRSRPGRRRLVGRRLRDLCPAPSIHFPNAVLARHGRHARHSAGTTDR